MKLVKRIKADIVEFDVRVLVLLSLQDAVLGYQKIVHGNGARNLIGLE